jgi:hypothetical protein
MARELTVSCDQCHDTATTDGDWPLGWWHWQRKDYCAECFRMGRIPDMPFAASTSRDRRPMVLPTRLTREDMPDEEMSAIIAELERETGRKWIARRPGD